MGSRLVLAATLACACNAQLGPPGAQPDGPRAADAALGIDSPTNDAGLPAWGAPLAVSGAAVAGVNQDDCTLNSTQTELYFKKPSAAGTDQDLYWMTRATPSDPWGAPVPLSAVDTAANEESPRLSP